MSMMICIYHHFKRKIKDMRKLQYCTATQIKFGTRKLNPSKKGNKKSNLEKKGKYHRIKFMKTQNKKQVKLLEMWVSYNLS